VCVFVFKRFFFIKEKGDKEEKKDKEEEED
jgi:hypothetical protein